VAVNKIDLPEVQARLPEVKQSFAPILSGLGAPVFYVSAVSGQAVLELVRKAMEMVDQASQNKEIDSQAHIKVFRPKPRK
jgi:hypothetical protein